jgi:hypothetical protein
MRAALAAVVVELGRVMDALALQMQIDTRIGSRAVGRALLYADRAVKLAAKTYRRVLVRLLATHAIKVPSRESMSFASLQFSLRGALDDLRLLANGVADFRISHEVVLHGLVPNRRSLRAVSDRRKQRRKQPSDDV